MKTLKAVSLIAAAVVAAALLVGASAKRDADMRPEAVEAERWVALGDKAGFALTTQKGNTIGAELYLKTENGWRRGRLENPFTVSPVTR